MSFNNPQIDQYLKLGCSRCALYATPECKVHIWPMELESLRAIALSMNLTEELKWGVPCYTYQNSNILVISAFKNFAAISFFKGSLLLDSEKILEKPGENSQASRLIKFTSVEQIFNKQEFIKAYIKEAIEIEKKGLKVSFKKPIDMVFPKELIEILENDKVFNAAFNTLTPGRQKGYLLHFSAPKQSSTRISRIEKSIDKILKGKGLNDY